MPTVVVPFRSGGKSRLPVELRVEVALAMLGDVLDAAATYADRVLLVTDDDSSMLIAESFGATIVADPGGGQGAAVLAAVTGLEGPCVVLNADLPCVTPEAIARLSTQSPAFVAAADGTTNALSLPDATLFEPLYGAGSAARFAAVGLSQVSIIELEQDVDTVADLETLARPVGPRTSVVLNQHKRALERTS